MWPALKQQLSQAHCDLSFVEVVHKSMQVPSQLKVAADTGTVVAEVRLSEDCPPSFRMYVPDRLLLAEMMDVPFSPQSVNNQLSLESATQMRVDREPPFLSCASQASTQEPKQQVDHSHSQKERVGLDSLQLAQQGAGERQNWSQGRSLALQGSIADSGGSSILAMRKQLDKISLRLRSLEEQHAHWQQKEALVYAVLLSTCLLNAWLWMRR